MKVHLINPSDDSFGIGIITPRWLYVLAGATPKLYGDPVITDETLEQIDFDLIQPGDIVGIGIHTASAHRGLAVGREARRRGATVIFGGIHATLYPQEAISLGGAHAVVKGDGDVIWAQVLKDAVNGTLQGVYDGGRVGGGSFVPARWDLLPENRYMWASVQTVRGCPKHCSFCSVWRTDGQAPRQRTTDAVVAEIVELRRLGFRFIALADDNFYPASFQDLELARRQKNMQRLAELESMREDRFHLMRRLATLPRDMVFFTQITIEASEDVTFLDAMREANIKGGLVGVESVTEEGLKSVYKSFNPFGEALAARLRIFRDHGVHVLGSFIFGLPTDRASTFEATAALASQSGLTFAQFVTMTPYPGTVDFQHWEKAQGETVEMVEGVPITRYWLIPSARRPKLYTSHPTMSMGEIRLRTQEVWNRFYSVKEIWKRADCVKSMRGRLAFLFISKIFLHMYANTGMATDNARRKSANRWARWMAKPCLRLFKGKPLPGLELPDQLPAPAAFEGIRIRGN